MSPVSIRQQILIINNGSPVRSGVTLKTDQLIVECLETGFVLLVIRALGFEQILQSFLHLQYVVLVILLPLHVQGFVSFQSA